MELDEASLGHGQDAVGVVVLDFGMEFFENKILSDDKLI